MYCNQAECVNAQDYVELNVLLDENKSLASKRVYLNDLRQENVWTEKSFNFYATEDSKNIQVI